MYDQSIEAFDKAVAIRQPPKRLAQAWLDVIKQKAQAESRAVAIHE
jgi:hypothetical protein